MKTIGLVGGMSWVSTAEYYRLANELVAERLGGLHSAKILMHSVDFAEIEELKRADDWEAVGDRLATAAVRLQDAGADLVLLCTNTMHNVAHVIEGRLAVPFLHLADTTAHAVAAAGIQRVALLGTAFTMNEAFYRDRVARHGIEVMVPSLDDRDRVSAIIYDELVHDVVTEESRRFYLDVVDRLVGAGAEGVILGCTEIELLIGPDDLTVPAFATTRLHVEAAIREALRQPATSD